MTILPKTCLGKWSVWLIVASVLLVLFFFAMTGWFDQRGGEGFFDNLLLTIPMLAAFGCGIVAFAVGLLSFFKPRERAVLVFLSTLIGLLVLIYGVAEVAFPH